MAGPNHSFKISHNLQTLAVGHILYWLGPFGSSGLYRSFNWSIQRHEDDVDSETLSTFNALSERACTATVYLTDADLDYKDNPR